MKLSYLKGFSFGLTSAIITTLGLIVGLDSGTHSKLAVLGGILTIAVADAFSDALGTHISEEAENQHTVKEIWESTLGTFIAKFVFALTFVPSILLFSNLANAIYVDVAWGLSVLALISFFMARDQKKPVLDVMGEHVGIAAIVIFLTHFLGEWISYTFGAIV